MAKKVTNIEVKDTVIRTLQQDGIDYVCITDIARKKNAEEPKDVVKNWMRLKNTIEYMGLWEKLNNPQFKGVGFDPLDDYIHFLFRSNPWIEEFYRNGRGIVADLWTINYQMMKGMYFPVPPLSEQRAIVAHITAKTAKINKMMENVTRETENFKEYKQRLISDVVTGQIKVC